MLQKKIKKIKKEKPGTLAFPTSYKKDPEHVSAVAGVWVGREQYPKK